MSVIGFEYKEVEGIANGLLSNAKFRKFAEENSEFIRHNERPQPPQHKFTAESFIGRLLWYMYVSNVIAYSLQYQENVDIFTPEEAPEKLDWEKAISRFHSLYYNCFTNSGTMFLPSNWERVANDFKKYFKENEPKIFEKGGVMKTYADFNKDYDAFTNYVMNRIDIAERKKIRAEWNKQYKNGEKDWNTFLLKKVNEKTSMKDGGEVKGYKNKDFKLNDKVLINLGDAGKGASSFWVDGQVVDTHPNRIKVTRKLPFGEKNFEEIDISNKYLTSDYIVKEEDSKKYLKGGEVDLFEQYDKMPKPLAVIVEKYQKLDEDGDMDYAETENFLKEVQSIGYTFDYGLDNSPFNLRKISMEKGGEVKTVGKVKQVINKVKTTKGETLYAGHLYIDGLFVKYFPTREKSKDVEDRMNKYLTEINYVKYHGNSGRSKVKLPFLIFWNDGSGERQEQFKTEKEAKSFVSAIESIIKNNKKS